MVLSASKRLIKTTRSVLASSIRKIKSSTMSNKTAALIFMHGLGDTGRSWQMQLSGMIPSHVKCICPTAPIQAVTLNCGMEMNSWFDLRSLDPNETEDEVGIEAATKTIHDLIAEQEKAGIKHDRIMIGGFSQGGALSIHSALKYPKQLAGVVALSCWLPLNRKFPAAAEQANTKIPFLQCHGDEDFIVPLAWGQASQAVLSTFLDHNKYQYKVYPQLGHSTSAAELHDVVEFIKANLPVNP